MTRPYNRKQPVAPTPEPTALVADTVTADEIDALLLDDDTTDVDNAVTPEPEPEPEPESLVAPATLIAFVGGPKSGKREMILTTMPLVTTETGSYDIDHATGWAAWNPAVPT